MSGTVSGEQGSPLPGVTVLQKNSSNGTQTDIDGSFTMIVPQGDTLLFSFIGFKTEEAVVTDSSSLSIRLTPDVTSLDEVVVVGYGTQSRSRVVSAVDQVEEEAFEGRPVATTTQALQGQSPGLVIQQGNAEPGAATNLNIRGISTLGDNSPLIVIDGIVAGDINTLNPADIESVSVLKDAGSAAIYGSRASNGVVLITTKRGKKNQAMQVQYNGLVGVNSPRYFTEPVPGFRNAMLRNEAAFNSGLNEAVFTSEQIRQFRENGDEQWFAEEIVQDALQQNHNLSVSGGNENTTYLVSFGYTDQRNNFVGPEKGLKRYNYRVNLGSSYDKMELKATLAYAKVRIEDHSSSTGILMADAFRTPLIYSQRDSSGNFVTNDVLQQFNPLGILEEGGFRRYDNDDLFGNISAEYPLTDHLRVRGVFGGRLAINSQYERVKRVDFVPKGVYGQDLNTNDLMRRTLDLNTQLITEYGRSFNNVHDLDILLGASNENSSNRGVGIFKRFTDPVLGTPVSSTVIDESSYNSNESSSANSLNSVFGRVSYAYDSKYFGEFSFRYDGSSRFREDLRWGFFPSVSVGYNLTDEDFLEGYRSRVGGIKLRASYGVLGNQNVGDFQYQTTYFTFQNAYAFNNAGVSGTGFNFANPNLRWERAATLNIGADLHFFDRALSLTLDYYDKVTSDILVPPAVPGTFGTDLPDFNAGQMRSRGWEVSATYQHVGNLFNHSLRANLGDTRNEVLDFQGEEILLGIEELQVVLREGLPYRSYVGLKRDGIFQSVQEAQESAVPEGLTPGPGDNKYADQNNDGVINDEDKFVFGNPFPRLTFGLTYRVEVKNIDFSLFVQGVGKRTMMIRGEQVEPFHFNYGATAYTHQLDYWTPENTDAYYPRLANAGTQSNTNNFRRGSDMYLFDGAYARLKNLQLGYTLPTVVSERIGLQKLRVYLSGQNLWTWSKVSFVDPELTEFDGNLNNAGANSARAYPTLVYYGAGLDITF